MSLHHQMPMSYPALDPSEHPGTPEYLEMLKERLAQQRTLYDLYDEVLWDEDHLYRPHS